MNSATTRSTIYFEPELHKTLRMKAASTHRSVSDLVNEAVRLSLAEDQEDLSAFDERVAEPTMSYEAMMQHAKLSASKRSQTIRLPEAAAFPTDVKGVDVVAVGRSRVVSPAGTGWDAWFDGPAASPDFMDERNQPVEQERETL
jgi:virulence-associated protein VagC